MYDNIMLTSRESTYTYYTVVLLRGSNASKLLLIYIIFFIFLFFLSILRSSDVSVL